MKQLPKSVKIGPMTYTVKENERLVHDEVFGQITRGAGRIEIRTALTPQFQEMILWHEMLHAVLAHGGFREQDERMVDVLAHGIVQLLQDNPELVAE